MDIAEWLEGLGLGQYARTFAENAVRWDVLPKLTTEDLEEIGVAAVGDRRRVLDAIATLGARNLWRMLSRPPLSGQPSGGSC